MLMMLYEWPTSQSGFLIHSYDCINFLFSCMLLFVCVCFRFLESQLRSQRSQQDGELKALQQQLSQAISGSSSGAQRQVSTYCSIHLWCMKSFIERLCINEINESWNIVLMLLLNLLCPYFFKNFFLQFSSSLKIYAFFLTVSIKSQFSWVHWLYVLNLKCKYICV